MLWGPAKSCNLAPTLKLQFQPLPSKSVWTWIKWLSHGYTLYPMILRIFSGSKQAHTKKARWKIYEAQTLFSSSFNGFFKLYGKQLILSPKFPPGWHSPQLLSAISLKKDCNWIVHNPDAVTKQALWTKQLHGDHHILEACKGTFSVYGFGVIGGSSHLLRFLK